MPTSACSEIGKAGRAGDEGVAEMAPANFVKVSALTPDSLNVDLVVKVLSCDAQLHCLSSGTQFACVTVGDETGFVLLRLDSQQARLCDPGTTLVLRAARAELFHGQLRLELGRWSRIARVSNAAFTPSDNDVSAVKYGL
ncbi:unnamed protein product [Effrenium voratum]|uniref:Single-stranded DNA binding protein Ssb-like OB fold domain-containing protein n=1 Tax=Effrenium voratum TaxID=2562239 RepID=A0AA36IEH7_9DINO|nr:unnamed protein product [Effrenium voratum]CAJ1385256.1 unnamed protein product [Effrenium voratum]